jgi:hypothetical protein
LATLLLVAGVAQAQPAPPGDPRTLDNRDIRHRLYELANTAGSEAYLSENEKTVILLCNLARLNGPYFVRNYLHFYKDTGSTRYKELRQILVQRIPIQPLKPAYGLYRSASIQANDMGASGQTGIDASNGLPFYERIHKQLPGAGLYASSFYLGSADPLEVVLGMLVAENDSMLPYRHNLLSAKVDFVGVSIRPHKRKCANTVIDFARRPEQILQTKSQTKAHKKTELYWMDCPKGTKIESSPRRRHGGGILGRIF